MFLVLCALFLVVDRSENRATYETVNHEEPRTKNQARIITAVGIPAYQVLDRQSLLPDQLSSPVGPDDSPVVAVHLVSSPFGRLPDQPFSAVVPSGVLSRLARSSVSRAS